MSALLRSPTSTKRPRFRYISPSNRYETWIMGFNRSLQLFQLSSCRNVYPNRIPIAGQRILLDVAAPSGKMARAAPRQGGIIALSALRFQAKRPQDGHSHREQNQGLLPAGC